jgi:hypothetical protein
VIEDAKEPELVNTKLTVFKSTSVTVIESCASTAVQSVALLLVMQSKPNTAACEFALKLKPSNKAMSKLEFIFMRALPVGKCVMFNGKTYTPAKAIKMPNS